MGYATGATPLSYSTIAYRFSSEADAQDRAEHKDCQDSKIQRGRAYGLRKPPKDVSNEEYRRRAQNSGQNKTTSYKRKDTSMMSQPIIVTIARHAERPPEFSRTFKGLSEFMARPSSKRI
jgi:hypothetical protein